MNPAARFAIALSLAPLFPLNTNAGDAIELGIFPYVNSSQIVRHHTSLQKYLARHLGDEVRLSSTRDMPSFIEATREGSFDLVLTAPHLGRQAQVQYGYRPVAQTDHNIQALFVTHKDSGITRLADLKYKTVAIMPPPALIVRMVEKQLEHIGLEHGKNITFKRTTTHNNALYEALRKESDAGVTGILMWKALGPEHKSMMRLIATTEDGPGYFLMAHPRISENQVARVREVLFQFSRSPACRDYFHKGYIALSDIDLQRMDPYVPAPIAALNSPHAEKN